MITKTKVLKFGKDAWEQPIVCRLASEYGLTFSILKARVLPRQEGLMVLEISGKDADYDKGIAYLIQSGVKVDSIEQEIIFEERLCTQCGACTGFCPSNALIIKDRKTMEVGFVSEDCIGCELCLTACPSRALRQSEDMLLMA